MNTNKIAERRDGAYKKICGILIPRYFSEEAFLSAVTYKPKPNDLFIVTYPKCGTTWMQHIVMLILRRGKPLENAMDFFRNSPFLEKAGAGAVDLMTTKGALKLHLPFRLTPFYPHAKYIYVARNPKDCCVSFYHHAKTFLPYYFADVTFDDFLEMFLKGEVEDGDYFDHLIPWYEHRNEENVYFTTYENLKRNTKKEILNLARFIGEEYRKDVMENSKILEDILYYSSFEYMEKYVNNYFDEFYNYLNGTMNNLPIGWKYIYEYIKNDSNPKNPTNNNKILRKGIIGDWKNNFTKEQEEKLNKRIKEKTKRSDVMKLWQNI